MIIKRLAIFILGIIIIIPAFSQYRSDYNDLTDSEIVKALKNHISYFASSQLNGRKAGYPGEKEAAEYIYNYLKTVGIDLLFPKEGQEFEIDNPKDTIKSRNIIGFIQGYDSQLNKRYIVIGARMDNLGSNIIMVDGKRQKQVYYGANGNASGMAILLELAKRIQTNRILFRRSILLIGFGASEQSFAGAWFFLNKGFSDVKNIDAMINLDMLGMGRDDFMAYTAMNKDLNNIVDMVSGDLQPVTPKIENSAPYPSDYLAFYSKSIPSIYFSTGIYPQHNTVKDVPNILNYNDMEDELEYIYNFSVALSNRDKAPSFKSVNGSDSNSDLVYPYYRCDKSPSFRGHYDPKWFLENWVYQYLKYPKEAMENGVQGQVKVRFVIDKNGKIKDVVIIKSVSDLLDAEAIKVIKASPDWKPAIKKGKKVNCYMDLAIDFILTKRK